MIAKSKNKWNPRELMVLTLGNRLYWTSQQEKSGMENKQKINILLFRNWVISWVVVVSDLFLFHHLNSNCKYSVKSGNFQYNILTWALTISILLHWHIYTRFASTMENPSTVIFFFIGQNGNNERDLWIANVMSSRVKVHLMDAYNYIDQK